jgi:hypothetical protein
MTKAELIEALSEYPDDIMIVIRGYGGVVVLLIWMLKW